MKLNDRLKRAKPSFLHIFITSTLFSLCLNQYAFALENVEFVRELRKDLTNPVDVAISEAGDVFILDKKASQVFIFDSNGNFKSVLGNRGSQQGEFKKPSSIAPSPQGEIVVADTGNNRIQVFTQSGEFLFEFGNSGSKSGQFTFPNGVAVDEAGYIYVIDSRKRRLQSFSSKGVYIGTLQLGFKPVDIALDIQRNIYLLAPEEGKIVKYSSRGQKLKEITCKSCKRNYISDALSIAIDKRGDIYIVENSEQSIKKIDVDEDVLLSFGSEGDGRGQFDRPMGIAVDESEQLFIADSRNKRVAVFKVSGNQNQSLATIKSLPPVIDFDSSLRSTETIVDLNFVDGQGLYTLSDGRGSILLNGPSGKIYGLSGKKPGEFKSPAALDVSVEGQVFVVDSENDRLQVLHPDGTPFYHFGKSGVKTGQFSSPQGVAINSKGSIYVSDTENNRVQIFNRDGIFLSSFGVKSRDESEEGVQRGNFKRPKSLAIDSKDRLFVLDYDNHRIQIFDEHGVFLNELGEKGDGMQQFDRPIDIAIDENDYLYVADQGNNRIQIFDSTGKFVIAFGSYGEGPGYFPRLSSLTASRGKIYVSDFELDEIKVFNFNPEGIAQQGLAEVIEEESGSMVREVPQKRIIPEADEIIEEQEADEVIKQAAEDLVKLELEKLEKLDKLEELEEFEEVVDPVPQEMSDHERIYVTKIFYLPPNYDEILGDEKQQVRLLTRYEARKELADKLGVSHDHLESFTKIEKEGITEQGQFVVTMSAPRNIPREGTTPEGVER